MNSDVKTQLREGRVAKEVEIWPVRSAARYLGYRSTSILRIRRADVDIYGYVAKELAKMVIKSQLLSGLRSIYFNRTTKDERFTR